MEKSSMKDGGPAFPVLSNDAGRRIIAEHGGMSLRDYFAARIVVTGMAGGIPTNPKYIEDMVRAAYGVADAMIAEREK